MSAGNYTFFDFDVVMDMSCTKVRILQQDHILVVIYDKLGFSMIGRSLVEDQMRKQHFTLLRWDTGTQLILQKDSLCFSHIAELGFDVIDNSLVGAHRASMCV